jgi:ABC-type glycerol-3-phosphate transport system substrate-binding protein
MPVLSSLLQNKKLLIGIGVFLVLAIVAVFIFNKPKQAPTPTVNNQPVTITWWKPFYGSETYSQIIDDFKKIPGNQNVTINVVTKQYGDDYYKSLIADIARNAGPDIFTLRNDDLPAYKEYMAPISLFKGQQLGDYKTNFVDLVVRDTMDRDNVYAISSYVDNLQLYYNKTLLAQNEIALPPKTWSELDRQLGKLNRRDPNSLNFSQNAISLGTGGRGLDGPPNINRHQDIIPMILMQAGDKIYDYQQAKSVFGNPRDQKTAATSSTTKNFETQQSGNKQDTPAYRALKFYNDFSDVTTSRYSWNTASINNVDAFVEGRLAYMIHYSYMQDTIAQRNSRLQYGVSEVPQLDPSLKKTYGFFFMDGINRNLERDPSKQLQKQAAENFLYYLSLPDAQRQFVTKTRLPAARKDIIQEQLQGDEVLRIFAAGCLYADNYYKPDVNTSERIWTSMYERIQYQGQPLTESIQQAQQEYSIIVQSGPKLR